MATTQYPTFLTGLRLTADLLTSAQPLWVFKSAAESVTSSTTLQNDDELTVSGAAGSWFVEMELCWSAANSGAAGTADIKTAWTSTGTITPANRAIFAPSTDAGSADNSMTGRYGIHGFTTAIGFRGRSGGSQLHTRETSAFTATTAWSITLQWAQATSSGTATTLQIGSYLKAERVA